MVWRIRVSSIFLCSLFCIVFAGFSHAWEFNMSASSTYSYLYYSQSGSDGFFGKFNIDNGVDEGVLAPGAYAPINGWLGSQVNDLVSGSTASKNSTSTSFFPVFRANQAIRLGGVYRAGNVDTATFPGASVSFANGEWLQLWTIMEVPWGVVSFGKRSFGFGCGLQYDSSDRTEEYLALVADYGPMQFGFGIYPWRDQAQHNQGWGQIFTTQTPRFDLEATYWNKYDGNSVPKIELFGYVDYLSGPMEFGLGSMYWAYSAGPEAMVASSTLIPGNNWSRIRQAPVSITNTEGWIFAKYNNGRFFLNAEADWIYRTTRWQSSLNGDFNEPLWYFTSTQGGGSFFKPQYTESWRFMAEAGVLSGPLKLSVLYSRVPGPDRRHGVLIDRQPVLTDIYRPAQNRAFYSPDHGNATVFRPYTSLMVSNYGSGLGARNRGNDGYMVDASAIGARADFAVAANLNVFGSFFYARRVSHGQGWGHVRPLITPYDAGGHADGVIVHYGDGLGDRFVGTNANSGAVGLAYTNPSPAIPDDSLGWEVNLGMDWKLLEWWNVGLSAAYWQPGRWFNYACIDRSVPGWNNPTAANNWGVNPDRKIAPIIGFNASLSVNF